MKELDRIVNMAMQQPQGPAAQIAAPMNDTQLLCLMAAQMCAGCPEDHEPAQLVDQAIEIMAEAVAQMQGPALLQVPQQPRESIMGRAQAKAHAKQLLKSTE